MKKKANKSNNLWDFFKKMYKDYYDENPTYKLTDEQIEKSMRASYESMVIPDDVTDLPYWSSTIKNKPDFFDVNSVDINTNFDPTDPKFKQRKKILCMFKELAEHSVIYELFNEGYDTLDERIKFQELNSNFISDYWTSVFDKSGGNFSSFVHGGSGTYNVNDEQKWMEYSIPALSFKSGRCDFIRDLPSAYNLPIERNGSSMSFSLKENKDTGKFELAVGNDNLSRKQFDADLLDKMVQKKMNGETDFETLFPDDYDLVYFPPDPMHPGYTLSRTTRKKAPDAEWHKKFATLVANVATLLNPLRVALTELYCKKNLTPQRKILNRENVFNLQNLMDKKNDELFKK